MLRGKNWGPRVYFFVTSFNSTSGDEVSGNGIYYLACVILEARVIKS